MNDRIQTYIHENYIGIMFTILCLVIAGVYVFCGRTTKPTSTNSNVSGTVQQIKHEVAGTGATIQQAQSQNQQARAALERANSAIGNSREGVRELQTELRIINAELERCATLNLEAQRELEQIKRGSK